MDVFLGALGRVCGTSVCVGQRLDTCLAGILVGDDIGVYEQILGEIGMDMQGASVGMGGIAVPEEYGGMGLGYYEHCMIVEELEARLANLQ